MNDTVAIVGTHPDTRDNAPFDDPSVDIWVFNEAASKRVKDDQPWAWRVDAVFQMHLPVIYKSKYNRSDPYYWQWLQEDHPFPIYMHDVDPEVPAAGWTVEVISMAVAPTRLPGETSTRIGRLYTVSYLFFL